MTDLRAISCRQAGTRAAIRSGREPMTQELADTIDPTPLFAADAANLVESADDSSPEIDCLTVQSLGVAEREPVVLVFRRGARCGHSRSPQVFTTYICKNSIWINPGERDP